MMRNLLMVFVATVFQASTALAQTEYDSLLQVLPNMPSDTNKVLAYKDLGALIQYKDQMKGIEYGLAGVELAEEIDYPYGKGRCLYLIALCYDIHGDTEDALVYFDKAYEVFEEIGAQIWMGNCINSRGVAYYFADDLNKALEQYLIVLEHWEKIDHKEYASQTLNNIGIIYRVQAKHEQAIDIYEKSVALKKELGDELGLGKTYGNIGVAYSYLGNEEKAIEYSQLSIGLFEKIGADNELPGAYGSLGSSLANLGRYEEADVALDRAVSKAKDFDILHELARTLIMSAKVKNKLGKYEEGLIRAEMALATDKNPAEHSGYAQAYYELAQSLGSLSRFEEAFDAMNTHGKLNAEIHEQERIAEMESMQAQFDVKQHEQGLELSQLKLADKERQEVMLIWGLALAGLLLLLAVWLVRNKVKNNQRLSEKNGIIQKSLEEKEVLLKEIHHRVKNNLQIISSLLSIQSRDIEDEVALEAVNESRNRVKSMAIIHQNLYQEDNLTGIDVGDYVEKLSQSLFASYRVDRDNIILKTDIDHLNLDVDTTIPLGLILNELITNALKYAFADRESGLLEVKLKEGDDFLELSVKDNGVGMERGDLSKGDSFGMKMIQTFAKKLDAEWEVNGKDGTMVNLRIKNYKKAS